MKILQIQTQAEAGGAQRISDLVGHGLIGHGYDVKTAFLYRRTAAFDADPNALFMLPEEPASALDYVRSIVRLMKFARRFKPDAIVSYQHYGNIAGFLAKVCAGVPVLIANQNGLPDGVGIPRKAMILDRYLGMLGAFSANVLNSRATEKAFASYPAPYRSYLTYIEHGVSPMPSTLAKMEARKKYGLPVKMPLVGAAGRLADQKNHVFLVEAVSQMSDVALAIAGNGPLRQEIEKKAKQFGVLDRLYFVGEIAPEEMGDYFCALDCFAFPSKWETFGLAVVEAAVAGVPIVCADLEILREVLSTRSGVAAALFRSTADPHDFANGLTKVLTDSAVREELSVAATQLSEKYSVEKMVRSYDLLIRSKIGTPQVDQTVEEVAS